MLVHRDNDDQSGDKQPDKAGMPHLVAPGACDAAVTPLPQGEDAAPLAEDGKTQLIGDALKSVYQRTLEEDIPDDFLDLLKQLK